MKPGKDGHQGWSKRYGDKWDEFFKGHPKPTIDDILEEARKLAKEFGFDVLF